METKDLIIYTKEYPAREAVYSDFPENMLPELAAYLESRGIRRLYCHQAEMFEKAQEGKNLVITTSTASGKTLSFLLPVIQEILKNPQARAIFIYPTKALAADQYRAVLPVVEYFGENRIAAGVYDGDTTAGERSRIRKHANLILTNPEMLNSAFLPNHSRYGFDFIFSNLKFVVIDELHTYRGAFGSHLANVFRRLERVCRYYRSSPRFLCSSATIANPAELAGRYADRFYPDIQGRFACGAADICVSATARNQREGWEKLRTGFFHGGSLPFACAAGGSGKKLFCFYQIHKKCGGGFEGGFRYPGIGRRIGQGR
ncbi:MAG: DEAD/DEAH box helicase [Eisenbergiella sp.]